MIDTKADPLLAGHPSSIPVAARTVRLFNLLAVASVAIAVLLPLAVVLYWTMADQTDVLRSSGLTPDIMREFGATQRFGAAFVTVLTVLPLSWALVRLRVCFTEFAGGRPFAARGIAGLRDFAAGVALAALAKLIGFTLLMLVLTWSAPPGMRQLAIQINSDMLIMALFAAIVASLGWAMEKAAAIAEENSQFV
ncbi:hypothetical protein N8A98_05455 [Devosia neptuniae]|uniref:DUF2975 domain-containing protein n=1 Tax=Devosia neptuniae TaxID=191302 RepID=A0ABY6CEL8_9HYPH|nr:hypothetical protein [Devosia neptuniae]UXN70634.1 hypothetical protein N8A98_05455 [Devosia neptuniae]